MSLSRYLDPNPVLFHGVSVSQNLRRGVVEVRRCVCLYENEVVNEVA